MIDVYGKFEIRHLGALQQATKTSLSDVDSLWTRLSNDAWYAFAIYVQDATDVRVGGYWGKDELDSAFEACMRTIGILEQAVGQLNSSEVLCKILFDFQQRGSIVSSSVEVTILDEVNRLIGRAGQESPLGRLLFRVGTEVVAYLHGAENVSEIVEFTSKSIQAKRSFEVALSGGGMRAAAFSLGVLRYLQDADKLNHVRQISSVSGGSIANGFVANCISEFGHDKVVDFDLLAKRLAYKGLPLERMGRLISIIFAFAVLGLAAGGLFGILTFAGLINQATGLFALTMLTGFGVAYVALSYRSLRVLTTALLEIWFRAITSESETGDLSARDVRKLMLGRGSVSALGLTPRLLRDVSSPIVHVFSTTDLRHGEHVHLSPDWVLSGTYGASDPGDVTVDESVRASAAFPGALPPVQVDLERLSLSPSLTVGEKSLTLVDGGVRDNLGHVFQSKLSPSGGSASKFLTGYGAGSYWIVVDSSAPRGVADLTEGVLQKVPVLRRFAQVVSFPRVIGIMNQSNSEARAYALRALMDGSSDGCVVSIQDSPVDLCRAVIQDDLVVGELLNGRPAGAPHDPRAARAGDVLLALGLVDDSPEAFWAGCTNRNKSVTTTLDSLGAESVARLMRHGYVSMMSYGRIEMGWPVLPYAKWTREAFKIEVDVPVGLESDAA